MIRGSHKFFKVVVWLAGDKRLPFKGVEVDLSDLICMLASHA